MISHAPRASLNNKAELDVGMEILLYTILFKNSNYLLDIPKCIMQIYQETYLFL